MKSIKKIKRIKINWNDFWINFGVGVLTFLFGLFLFSTIWFLFNGKINFVILILSILITLIYWWSSSKKTFLLKVGIFVGTSLIFFAICNIFFDLTYDGQSYHQEAVIQLANGWNPIMEKIVPDVWDHSYAIWLNHFPKFSWIVPAVVYNVFNKIELAKIINWLLVLSVFSLGFGYINLKFKNTIKSFLLAMVVAFNPVSISQMNSFCIDTQLASVFSLIIIGFLLYFDSQWKNKKVAILLVIMSFAILVNIKMTALAYLFIIFIGFSIWVVVKKLNFKEWIGIWVLAFSLGIFVLGFDPYITNTFKFGHPFYPMYMTEVNKDSKTIAPALPYMKDLRKFIYDSNMPKDFIEKDRIWKFFRSYLFAKSSNLASYSIEGKYVSGEETSLKLPMSLSKQELKVFESSDVRIAGFGVFFSGMLIISLLIVFISLFDKNKDKNKNKTLILIGFWLMLIVASLLNPEAWWARYVPFLWLIPISVVFLFTNRRNFFLKIGSWLLLLIIICNLSLIGFVMLRYQWFNSRYRFHYAQNLEKYNEQNSLPVVFDFGPFRANRIYYQEMGVKYIESSLEIGIMENQIIPLLNENEKDIISNLYTKDIDNYKYKVKENLSNEEMLKLAGIYKKIEKMIFIKSDK